MAGGERRAAVNPAGTGPRRRRWLLLAAAALIAVLVGGRWLALETAEHAWAATITGGGGDAYLAARSLARLMRIVVFVVSVGWGTLHLWFIYRSLAGQSASYGRGSDCKESGVFTYFPALNRASTSCQLTTFHHAAR